MSDESLKTLLMLGILKMKKVTTMYSLNLVACKNRLKFQLKNYKRANCGNFPIKIILKAEKNEHKM